MKPTAKKQRKERDIDKDTVVAYHEFIQGRIQGELNGVTIGPGYMLSRYALVSFIFGLACMLTGILVITLRHRHVYLVDWNAQFLGPFFIIVFLLCCSLSTFLLLIAKQRTNQYRRDLAVRYLSFASHYYLKNACYIDLSNVCSSLFILALWSNLGFKYPDESYFCPFPVSLFEQYCVFYMWTSFIFFTNFTLSVPDVRYLHSLQNSYSLYDDIFQFRPIGDYGVAVVHKSKLNYDDKKK